MKVPQLVFNCSCKYFKNVSYLADLVCVKVLLVRLRVVVENICKLLNIGLIIVGYLTLVCLLFVKSTNIPHRITFLNGSLALQIHPG